MEEYDIIQVNICGGARNEVAVIKAISDGKEAMKEFVNCKPGELVYSTKNKEIVIQLVGLTIYEKVT